MDTSQKFTDGMTDYQKSEFWKLQNENKELANEVGHLNQRLEFEYQRGYKRGYEDGSEKGIKIITEYENHKSDVKYMIVTEKEMERIKSKVNKDIKICP